MPRSYKQNCRNCKEYYEGEGKYFCSNVCNGLFFSRENNINWKGGRPFCLDCKKVLSHSRVKRCRPCSTKYFSGKNSPIYGKLGIKSPNWKGGLTLLQDTIRTCKKYKDLLKESKKRDNFQCLMPNCDSKTNYLHSNHIKTFSSIVKESNTRTFPEALRCKKLWDITNLITLCRECHRHIRGREQEFENLFKVILQKLYYT